MLLSSVEIFVRSFECVGCGSCEDGDLGCAVEEGQSCEDVHEYGKYVVHMLGWICSYRRL